MNIQTITLNTPHNFLQALQKLVDGECLGIKPGANLNYLEINQPRNWMLTWARSVEGTCRIEQFLSTEWYLVIADHRKLPKTETPTLL